MATNDPANMKTSEEDQKTCHQKHNWIRKYHTEITALSALVSACVTIVLAIIAYQSWVEVAEQRQQLYQQFRQANLPEIEILFPEIFEISPEKVSTKWGIKNNGGTAEDIRRALYIIYRPENTKGQVLRWLPENFNISRNRARNTLLQVDEKHWLWLKDSLQNQNDAQKPELFAFAKVWFFVPALGLGEERQKENITAAFYWDPLYETWKTADYDMAINLEKYLDARNDFPE
ncbi:MAG: hypothetical protein PF441_03540 [Desulfuromusa sp.]|jgi:hypothetical protein|nr:hypothetical protein [Desulfuromusa sp.]